MGIIRKYVPTARDNDPFIDTYVLLFPIIPLSLAAAHSISFLRPLTVALGAWRIFEVIVFLSNTYLFDDYRARMREVEPRKFGGIRRVLFLTAANYVELIFWFAAFYRLLIPELSLPTLDSFVSAINFSFVVMSAFGTSSIQSPNWCVTLVTLVQSVIGLAMALAVIARSVSLLPTRGTGDRFEDPDQ